MERSRRAVLAAVGGSTLGLAGCLGGSDPYDCEEPTPDPVADLPRPVAGDPDADVRVVVFEDFASPASAEWRTEEFPAVVSEYVDPGAVRLEHWDFPIPASEWSEPVANAARGVQDRHGDAAFFEFSASVFERQADLSDATIGEIAASVGADPCRVLADADAETYEDVLLSDREAGALEWRIEGPTVFVEEERVEPTADAVSTAVDARRQ